MAGVNATLILNIGDKVTNFDVGAKASVANAAKPLHLVHLITSIDIT